MKLLKFFSGLCLITLFAACTSQVETNLPEPETLNVTTDDDREVVLRSTQAECKDYYEDVIEPGGYTGQEYADYVQCRLNQGFDTSDVQTGCDFSEQYVYTTCISRSSFNNDYSPEVDRQKNHVANNTDPCTTQCVSPDPVLGCRTIIFRVTFLNDHNCPNSPDEWEFRITADVYCCD